MLVNVDNVSNFLAKIEISKKHFFGDKIYVIFYITPNLLLLQFEKKFSCNFPFEKNKVIDLSELEKWSIENNFKVSFSTNNSHLKRQLLYQFDKPVVHNTVSKKKYKVFNHVLFKKIKNIY